MKLIKNNRTILLGISTGLFISAIFVFIFSAFFSYTQETNQVATIVFAVSLLIYYIVETVRQTFKPSTKLVVDSKITKTILITVAPILGSIILIQGDIRSWFLVIISILLTWVIIK